VVFSLVVATIGRDVELRDMLTSIATQNYDLDKIEIIIIDQNKKGYLADIIREFSHLRLIYIHSDKRGLSYNRNIGLRRAKGDIICFPDDDCKYYKDTLSLVSEYLKDDKIDFCMGRIYDREKNKDIIRKWPKNKLSVNLFNTCFITSSITLFIKKRAISNFDENLGAGASYGSCEDADLIYTMISNKYLGTYNPLIQMWHPVPGFQVMSLERVESYSAGFGYFVRKETDAVKIALLTILVLKKAAQFLFNLCYKKFPEKYFKRFFSGLLRGLKKTD